MSNTSPPRRQVLSGLAATLAGASLPRSLLAQTGKRRLNMRSRDSRYNRIYWRDGQYLEKPVRSFYRFMWDWRAKKSAVIDLRLMDILFFTQQELKSSGVTGPLLLISGYRTPETNARLSGAARNSLHMKGMAADIRLSRGDVVQIQAAATKVRNQGLAQVGGIGYYPSYNWVHLDCSGVRDWVV